MKNTIKVKVTSDFWLNRQKNKALEIKGAVIDGSFCDASKLADLGKVGTKENALAMLCGALQSPIRNFAYGLKSYAEKEQN